ncbi:MAG: hypothetical protein HZB30_06705 [Nitrospirae bacterium]|nr:hypothetical protein [Nitrospirota bacterium]
MRFETQQYKNAAILALTFLSLIIFFSGTSAAFTCTWTGAISNDASTPANWSGCNNNRPQNNDAAVFTSAYNRYCNWNITPSLSSFSINTGYTSTITLNSNLTMTGDITVNSGVIDARSSVITVGGNWRFFTGTTTDRGDVDGIQGIDFNDVSAILRMAINYDPTKYCADVNTDAKTDILDTVKTLRLSYGLDPLNRCSGGLFVPGTSRVVLNGGIQTVYGNNVFYDLTKTVSSSYTLYFEAGSTQTILGSLTLKGASGNLLALRSTDENIGYWYLDLLGTQNISYVDIRYLNNKGLVNIVATNSQGEGTSSNNKGVSFGGSQCVCREEKLILAGLLCDGRQSCER